MKNKNFSYKNYIKFYFYIILSHSSFSQPPINIDLNRDINIQYEQYLNGNSNIHTCVKPFLYSEAAIKDTNFIYQPINLRDHHFNPDSNGYIEFNPIISLQPGYGFNQSKSILESSLGFGLNGFYSNKIAFNFNVFAGNSGFVNYVDSNIKQTAVVPGLGSAYRSKLGYSYQNYSGYLSYSPNKIFNFQIGQGKHFFGDGYRSLFLSDVAKNYPFGMISTSIWKIKYVSLFTAFKDITAPTHLQSDFKNKYGTFHYLSWNVTKRINLNFFESIVWQGTDTNRTRAYDINYLNPVIFYRPVEYSLGSSDNAFLGFGFKVKAFRKQQFYGQLILDEFLLSEIRAHRGWWANKQGFQVGLKSFDLFSIINLTFQTELNYVRPYTYSHGSVQQNYGHYNQPLAHPLGANFIESVSFFNYQKKRWTYELKIISAIYGADTAGIDFGKDIFKSYANHPFEYGNKTAQGLKTNLVIGDLRIAYVLLPSINLKIEAGMTNRIETSSKGTTTTPFIYFGIRTILGNFYTDY